MGGSSSKSSRTSAVQPCPSSSQEHNSPQDNNRNATSSSLNIAIDRTVSDQCMNHGLNKNLSTDMLITPGREQSMYHKVAYTPQGEETRIYKYYCPLCMSFCMDIFKSQCCKNYVCGECCTDFLNKRGYQICTMHDILQGAPYQDACCPNCSTQNFAPVLVTKSDDIRDYSFDTSIAKPANDLMCSPLKIGDSFEVMKVKMERQSSSPTGIKEGIESPERALFPKSGTASPRGIAINKSREIGSNKKTSLHYEAASLFVNDIFSSQDHQQLEHNLNSISDVATTFVQNLFGKQIVNDNSSRRRRRVSPLSFDDDAFDTVSIDGANTRRENIAGEILAQ